MIQQLKSFPQYAIKHRFQTLSLLLWIVFLALIQVMWIRPVMDDIQAMRGQIRREKELVAKYRRKLSAEKDLAAQLAAQERELRQVKKRLVRGKDPYQFAASLSSLVASKNTKDLVIKSYQVLNSVEFGIYREVRLKFNLSATIKGLYHFLDRLEHAKEAISLQELNIQRRRLRRGPDLSITVVVAALMETTTSGKKS